ncbi:MAG: L-threonylcarbamoyladenylate synthase [Candidatus Nanohaloarchaea archaeon]
MEIDREEIEEARKLIVQGGIIIFPTETAYGIAADATNPEAIEKVYEAKQRPRSKGLTAIVSSPGQAEEYSRLSENEKRIVEEFMPGPLTLVAEKKNSIPESLNESFAFRIPGSEVARKLARDTPVTATSANVSGRETSYSIDGISRELREKVDKILDAGELSASSTSTVAEVNNSEIVIHRKGPFSKQDLESVL